jgi:LuxR family transcriptional regulator, maltose regulon positive regulatory protein
MLDLQTKIQYNLSIYDGFTKLPEIFYYPRAINMTDGDKTLLLTKLHRPLVTRNLISRPLLFEQLSDGINGPLILVCAPAGYGKTTLICTWLEHMAAAKGEQGACLPSAWLSLDEDESDLNRFLHYFIAALRTIFSETCDETLMLLQAGQQPPEQVLYTTLCNELSKLPGEVILVLDDYQFIRGKVVHGLLVELARHWPKPLHLVLISRIDPPLPLTSLRVKGMLREIRTQDLRFTPKETATYLSQAQFIRMSQPTLDLLEERFEGWPAGLHLAALSLRSAGTQESVQLALTNENANITGYLVDEVLTHQFPVIYSFLLKTSILDRFCAALCEAVIGEIDTNWNVRACLDWIERSELFLISLDDRREWYRYHHLFQESLQQRLSAEMTPDQVNTLHLRASTWFEEHGFIEEALQHALAAGDLDLAARQMYTGLPTALNHVDRPTLERWLRLLPEEIIQRHPGLLMISAWALQFLWRLDLQAQMLKQIEDLLDADGGASLPEDDRQLLRTQILLFRAEHAYFGNQPIRAIDLCQQALGLLPPSWIFGRGAAMLFLGLSMQASGQAQAAERLLLDEYGSHGDKTDIFALLVLDSLCFIYLHTGQLEQARQTAQVLAQGSTHNGIAFMRSAGDWFLGLVCYQSNELEAAAQHFTHIVDNRYTAQVTNYRDAVAGLALIHQIQGESSEAWRMVESISQFDLDQRGSEETRTRSLRARLMLLQGDLEGAGRWVDTLTDLPPDQPLMWLEEPQVSWVRILLARGGESDVILALKILDVLGEITERTHNTRYKIEILALRALVLDAMAQRGVGEISQADAVLKQAVDIARLGGFIRVFVDLGVPMQAMLRRLASQGHSVDTINRILAAFPTDDKKKVGSESLARQPTVYISTVAEPLTRRELDVLALLRGPLSIKEIAQRLNISYGTAKGYTINLYAKLGVNRRWDAVVRAEELNILPPR